MDHPLYTMMDDGESAARHADSSSGRGGGGSGSSVLFELLAQCGVSSAPTRPPAPYGPLLLSHPPHRVRLLLESELPRGDKATQFLAELTERCSDTEQLRRFISPTASPSLPPHTAPHRTGRSAAEFPTASPPQDSVIRICLNVLALQRPLLEWLLEQLAANEDEWLSADGIRASLLSQSGLTSQSLPSHCLPRLLLDQLRMLDVVYDSDALCSKLQEVMEAVSTVKAELITALPDILIDPCYHDKMADCLTSQLRVSGALLLPVLDCVSRLHLTSRQKERAVEAVRPLIASVREKNLPALIRFLLQMTSDDSVTDILDTMRLHMPQLAEDGNNNNSNNNNNNNNNNNGGGGKGGKEEREEEVSGSVLIVEALRSGLQQNKLACKAYLELLKADARECKAADVLIVFIIHSLPHNKQLSQKAADLLCRKVQCGLIPPALLHSSIVSHVGCIHPMFDSVAALSESMVRKHGDRTVREAGGSMQVDLFLTFDDRAQRMTTVQSWLQQLGSRECGEMDSALHCLQAVERAKSGVRSLAVYFEYLKTVLQYMDDYKLSQIRTLFQILASLAFKRDAVAALERGNRSDADDGSGCHPFDASLQVFIQKELYAPSLRDQRIGIVAVVALMQPIAAYSPHAEPKRDVQQQQHELPSVLCLLLDQLFGSLVKCTSRSPSAQSFLYDELSLALDAQRLLHIEVLTRVHKYFRSNFQPHLLVPRTHGEHPLPLTVDRQTTQVRCADQLAGPEMTAAKAKYSFNVTPTLLQPSPYRQLLTVPAEMRLLAACYRVERPQDEFVQLLIAPFTLPAPLGSHQVERLDYFKQQTPYLQRVWISSHFHAVQLLRELINAFSYPALQLDRRDREHLAPCLVHRVQQLLSAEDELRAMMKCSPDFTAQQLLSMADSTEERYTREMATLDGTMRADDSNRYTTLSGKVHITRKKKSGKTAHAKRRRGGSSEEEESSEESDDSEREEARRRRKRKAARKTAVEARVEDKDKAGPFDAVIRPLLRPLTVDVVQLICNPLSKNLITAAEAHKRHREKDKRQAKKQQEGDTHNPSNVLLLYSSPSESAKSNLPSLSVPVLHYLLTELRHHMEAVLSAPWSHASAAPFSVKKPSTPAVVPHSPAADSPVSLLAALSPVLRGVHDHYLVLSEFLDTSDEDDDDDDIDRSELTACLIACVHVVHIIVSCPAVTAPANRQSLQSAIVDLLGAVRQPSGSVAELSQIGEQSLTTLCDLLISRLRSSFVPLRCINDAVAVAAVFQEIDNIRVQLMAEDGGGKRASSNIKLHQMAGKMLNKEWTNKVPLRKQNVGELVSLLIRHAEEPVAVMNTIAARMLALAQATKKKKQSGVDEDEEAADPATRPYQHCLTKQTVPLWLLPMIEHSSQLLSAIDLSRLKSGSEYLTRLQQLVLLAADLLNLSKLYPRNLSLHKHCIRFALRMLESFTRGLDGMGKLLQHSKRHRNEEAVKQTLSAMQKVTRAFIALCVHVKEQQVASLMMILPKAKMAYESWLMAVKRFCKLHAIDFTYHTQPHTLTHSPIHGAHIPVGCPHV